MGHVCACEDTNAPRTRRLFTYMIQQKCAASAILSLSHHSALPTRCDLGKHVFGAVSSVISKAFLLSYSTGDSAFTLANARLSQKPDLNTQKFSVCPAGATVTIDYLFLGLQL